jgi:hypothetical protein
MASNYSCTECGRGFSRKSSAKRHVKTVEKSSSATVIPTPQYNSELRSSIRLPPVGIPSYKKEPVKEPNLLERVIKRFLDVLADEEMRLLLAEFGYESNQERYYGLLIERDFPDKRVDRASMIKKIAKLITGGEANLLQFFIPREEKRPKIKLVKKVNGRTATNTAGDGKVASAKV